MTSPKRFEIAYSPGYYMDLGAHVFPAQKYRLIATRLAEEGLVSGSEFRTPMPISVEAVERVHDPAYVSRMLEGGLSEAEIRCLELPFRPDLIEAFFLAAGGTLMACEFACEDARLAMNLSGGFHHAFRDHGEGFCLIHDVAIAVEELRARERVQRALLIDLDVHHGNGSASIFASVDEVFTLSIHQENNYPVEKPSSDLDIGLPDGTGDGLYLEIIERHFPQVLDEHRPDLVVYLAGADPYRGDRLGGLNLSLDGLIQRDRTVLQHCLDRNIATAIVLAGGYAENTDDTVQIHMNTVRVAMELAQG